MAQALQAPLLSSFMLLMVAAAQSVPAKAAAQPYALSRGLMVLGSGERAEVFWAGSARALVARMVRKRDAGCIRFLVMGLGDD